MRWAACPAVPPVTKQEYVSQNARERLFFAEKIADYLDALSRHADFEKAVNQVLAPIFIRRIALICLNRRRSTTATGTTPSNGARRASFPKEMPCSGWRLRP